MYILIDMTTKIRKWGNSAAVRIPKATMHKGGFRYGSEVEIHIKPIAKKYNLDELIASINPKNRHPETDWGPDVGNEILPEWKG
jgi:antitoxin MazE